MCVCLVHGYSNEYAHQLSSSGDFLDERMCMLANDSRFQERKRQMPVVKNETVQEIGKVHGFREPDWEPEFDDGSGFLTEKLSALSSDDRFQQRKEANPVAHKQTVSEMGTVFGFRDPKWHLGNSNVESEEIPVAKKLGPTEIGRIKYSDPEWSAEIESKQNNDTLFEERIHINKHQIENVNYYKDEIEKIGSKVGAQETGRIAYDAIQFIADDNDAEFLAPRRWYDSSVIHPEFANGLSWLLSSLPKYKIRLLEKQPLPTGYASKIAFLMKLKILVEEDMKENEELGSPVVNGSGVYNLELKVMENDGVIEDDAGNDDEYDADAFRNLIEKQKLFGDELSNVSPVLPSTDESSVVNHNNSTRGKVDGGGGGADDDTQHKTRRWLKYNRSQRMLKLNKLDVLLEKMKLQGK